MADSQVLAPATGEPSGTSRGERPPGQPRLWRLAGLGAVLLALLLVLQGAGTAVAPGYENLRSGIPVSLNVPRAFSHILHVRPAATAPDFATIQSAVDAARPGDLILIAPGTYPEAVTVKTPDITIRGEDRNSVMLDGGSKLSNGFFVNAADKVIIENITAHHYVGNGFYWRHVTGYRGSYLTAYDNGDYGIYAFDSTQGQFDHSYASGSPDSGFYIGQCFPCDALITDVRAQLNGLGYSGTNAGGNLIIRDSEWDRNSAGILPNSLDSEGLAPQRGATITHNKVHDNGDNGGPVKGFELVMQGVGIGLPGGSLNYVSDNEVTNNATYGILVSGIVEQNFWLASGNVVSGNTVKRSGLADLALAAPSGANNCFANNVAETTLPPLLEVTHACGTPLPLNGGGDMGITLSLFARDQFANGPNNHPPDFRTAPKPPAQANLPDINAGPAPIFTEPFTIDHSNGALPAAVGTGGTHMLAPLGFTGYTIVQMLLALYGNWSLFALYAVWLAVAFVELSRRDDMTSGRRIGWGAAVVGLPIVGAVAYYFAGGSKLSRQFRLGLVVGAPLLCLVVTLLLMVVATFTL